MPVCCRCNGSGRCRSCACVKSGRPCVDCLPSRKGNCCNNAHTSTSSTSSISTPALTTDNGNLPSSSPSADTSDTVNLHVTRELLTSHPSPSLGPRPSHPLLKRKIGKNVILTITNYCSKYLQRLQLRLLIEEFSQNYNHYNQLLSQLMALFD